MSTKNKLVWRLGKLPSVDELRELVKDKILTNEEAREILFSLEKEEERDIKSLQQEVKLLREVVDRLSHGNNSQVAQVIRQFDNLTNHPWFQPYLTWTTSNGNGFINIKTF